MKRKPQIKMAKEKETSDQDEEMVSTASASTSFDLAHPVPTASATASTTTSSGDPALQCEINPTEARTLRRLFRDFKVRRDGILKALTTEVETFHSLCDPDKDDLYLYGLPNGTWELKLPGRLPPSMPEPTVGINFARDAKGRKHWLALVAAHSDSWLIALTFYSGCDLGKNSRKELFSMINNLPTIHEVVTGAAKKPSNESTPKKSSKRNKSPSELMPPPKMAPQGIRISSG